MPTPTGVHGINKPLGNENFTRAAFNAILDAIDAVMHNLRYSTAQRDAFAGAQLWVGRVIYNTTNSRYEQWTGAVWTTDLFPIYALDTDLSAHVAAGDPHTQYALDTDLTTHSGSLNGVAAHVQQLAGGKTSAAAPSTYPIGVTSADVTAANGFPVDGVLHTARHAAGRMQQLLTTYSAALTDPKLYIRQAQSGDAAWSNWLEVFTSANHASSGDPHTQYALDSDLTSYIPKSIGTTKGDIIGFTGSGVAVRKAAGSNGQFLTAQSGQSDGLLWATHDSTGDPHTQYALDSDLAGYALKAAINAFTERQDFALGGAKGVKVGDGLRVIQRTAGGEVYVTFNAEHNGSQWVRILAQNAASAIVLSTDGSLLFYAASDAGNTVGSQITFVERWRLTKNGQESIRVYYNQVGNSISANTETQIPYDTVERNNGGFSLASAAVTCPRAGKVRVIIAAGVAAGTTGGYRQIKLRKNGAHVEHRRWAATNSTVFVGELVAELIVAANDTIDATFMHNHSSGIIWGRVDEQSMTISYINGS